MPTLDDVIDRLCCPITRQALHFRHVDAADIGGHWRLLMERFGVGKVVGVLETTDRQTLYPVWRDVIGLLAEFARTQTSTRQIAGQKELRSEKQIVAKFYDEFGWVEQVDGQFNDAIAFEDLRDITKFYRRRCHRRVNRHLSGGKYLLDCASGAVQIPEYVSFSETYEKRICVDLSIAGLLKAKERLGDHAICIVGDITALPLRTGSMDSFVSLHTVYHVPADEQTGAVAELYRVLQPGGTGVLVYSWGSHSRFYGAATKLHSWLGKHGVAKAPTTQSNLAVPDLYFSPHDYGWYRREIASRYPCKLRIWRSVTKDVLEWFAQAPWSARFFLWPLYAAEELLPRLFGRIGVCPMFVFRKPLRPAQAGANSPPPV